MQRPLFAALTGAALIATGAVAPAATPAPASPAAPAQAGGATITLVGSLQDELGCDADWDPACPDTVLTPVESSDTAYSGVFDVPEGSFEYKVTVGGTFDEAYPGDNVLLVLQGPATLEFSFDTETKGLGVMPTELSGPVGDADAELAGDSLRQPVTEEQFYFVMADRFANGDSTNDTGGIEGDRLDHGFDPTDKASTTEATSPGSATSWTTSKAWGPPRSG